MDLTQNINIKRIETKILNGRKINIKIILEVEVKVYSNEQTSLICNINNLQDIQVLSSLKQINSLIATGNTIACAKDTISISEEDEIAEIMKVGLRIINKDIKISYNKVLSKADVDIDIMYLTEGNKIKNVNTKIPIMGFIDIENISEDSMCDIDYTIKNVILKPNTGDLNSIYVEVQIDINCFAYELKSINFIEDLYSISENLNFKQKEIIAVQNKKKIKDICKVSQSLSIPEIEYDMPYNVEAKPIITNKTIKNGKIIFEGNLNIELLYGIANGVDSKEIQIPFTFEMLSENIDNTCSIMYSTDIKKNDFEINNGKLDISTELDFLVDIFKKEKLNIIDQIDSEKVENGNIYSMVIYFVKPKDTLWKIAKTFKSTVEDIARINKIEDPNKIYVGQQLYIPKFVGSKVAV